MADSKNNNFTEQLDIRQSSNTEDVEDIDNNRNDSDDKDNERAVYFDKRQLGETVDNSLHFIKVSQTSKIKTVAGKLSHASRSGQPPAVLAIGSLCVSSAIKAVAIARNYLEEDDLDLTCQPAFRESMQKVSIALYISKRQRQPPDDSERTELRVLGTGDPKYIAGALAARVRENQPAILSAIGSEAVSKAVMTVATARVYLEKDGIDIRCMPSFSQIDKEGQSFNAVRLVILTEQISTQ